MFSCNSLKKEYDNGEEAWKSVKGTKYDDIIKAWGEPDRRTPYDDRVDLSWSNSKVNIKEGTDGEVTLSFDKYYDKVYGRFEGIGKAHDLVCGEWQYYKDHKMKVHKVKF